METIPLTDSDRILLFATGVATLLPIVYLFFKEIFTTGNITIGDVERWRDEAIPVSLRRIVPLIDRSLQLGRKERAERLRLYAKRVEQKDRWVMITYWEFSADLDASIERAEKTNHTSFADKLRSKYGAAGALPYHGELA